MNRTKDKLYLDGKLQSIPVFRVLLDLISKFQNNDKIKSELLSTDDIYNTKHLYDPVEDFLEYYIQTSNIQMDEGRKQYIVNALYAAKGSPLVFDILEEVYQINLEYNYPFPEIELLSFESIKINNIEVFMNKLITMLYYLLYFTTINIHIKNLILSLQGELIQYSGGLILGYQLHEITDIRVLP